MASSSSVDRKRWWGVHPAVTGRSPRTGSMRPQLGRGGQVDEVQARDNERTSVTSASDAADPGRRAGREHPGAFEVGLQRGRQPASGRVELGE
jgi:hypothetical protein